MRKLTLRPLITWLNIEVISRAFDFETLGAPSLPSLVEVVKQGKRVRVIVHLDLVEKGVGKCFPFIKDKYANIVGEDEEVRHSLFF